MRAVALRGAVAILIAGTTLGLTVGSANAETVAPAELEATDSADSGVRDATPTAQRAEQSRERRELQTQRREEWWTHARAVLFGDIQLSAEQARGVDAIIATQLDARRRSGELRAELRATQQQADTERSAAIRAENRAIRTQLKGRHECMAELRALLSEEQRPTFDRNRARLAAEGQQPQKKRRPRKRGADLTCPPEIDPACIFGSCFGSSEEQVNGQETPHGNPDAP